MFMIKVILPCVIVAFMALCLFSYTNQRRRLCAEQQRAERLKKHKHLLEQIRQGNNPVFFD